MSRQRPIILAVLALCGMVAAVAFVTRGSAFRSAPSDKPDSRRSTATGGATAVSQRVYVNEFGKLVLAEMGPDGKVRVTETAGRRVRNEAVGKANSGDLADAIDLLRGYLATPCSAEDRADTLRILAQFLEDDGKRDDAAKAFEDAFAAFESDPDAKQKLAWSYWSVVNQLSIARLVRGDVAGAREVNARMFDPNFRFEADSVSAAYIHESNWAERVGDRAGAIDALRTLRERNPDYGRKDGRIANVLLREAQLSGPSWKSLEVVTALTEVWNEPDTTRFPQVIDTGEQLVDALHRVEQHEAALVIQEGVVERIDALLDARGLSARVLNDSERQLLQERRVSALSSLCGADTQGRPDIAVRAIARLRQMPLLPEQQQALTTIERRVLEAIAKK